MAAYLPYSDKRKNDEFQEITCSKANTFLDFSKTPYTREVTLEKHSQLMLGTAELPSENLTLTDFMALDAGKTVESYRMVI